MALWSYRRGGTLGRPPGRRSQAHCAYNEVFFNDAWRQRQRRIRWSIRTLFRAERLIASFLVVSPRKKGVRGPTPPVRGRCRKATEGVGTSEWNRGQSPKIPLNSPPAILKVNWPEGSREGGLGRWFLCIAAKELAVGTAKHPNNPQFVGRVSDPPLRQILGLGVGAHLGVRPKDLPLGGKAPQWAHWGG